MCLYLIDNGHLKMQSLGSGFGRCGVIAKGRLRQKAKTNCELDCLVNPAYSQDGLRLINFGVD